MKDALCSVTPAAHATGFNLSVSVNTLLTSERDRKKAEVTGEGEEGG